MPDTMNFRSFEKQVDSDAVSSEPWQSSSIPEISGSSGHTDRQPIILDDKKYDRTEVMDDHLALEDMEKEMIKKSLKRHGGRRKEAAIELGISERTLYRKIKQYDI